MTFTAIVTAHAMDPSRILGNLLYQTRKPDEIICLVSDVDGLAKLMEHFGSVMFVVRPNRSDWGHDKRAHGLELVSSEAVGFFNADDEYDIKYVEKMLAPLEAGADVVFCNWRPMSPHCQFLPGSSTSGNFVVRTELARKAGWSDRHYEADGTFINRLRDHTDNVVKVEEMLYIHN